MPNNNGKIADDHAQYVWKKRLAQATTILRRYLWRSHKVPIQRRAWKRNLSMRREFVHVAVADEKVEAIRSA